MKGDARAHRLAYGAAVAKRCRRRFAKARVEGGAGIRPSRPDRCMRWTGAQPPAPFLGCWLAADWQEAGDGRRLPQASSHAVEVTKGGHMVALGGPLRPLVDKNSTSSERVGDPCRPHALGAFERFTFPGPAAASGRLGQAFLMGLGIIRRGILIRPHGSAGSPGFASRHSEPDRSGCPYSSLRITRGRLWAGRASCLEIGQT